MALEVLVTDELVQELVNEVDEDGRGDIEFDEFGAKHDSHCMILSGTQSL